MKLSEMRWKNGRAYSLLDLEAALWVERREFCRKAGLSYVETSRKCEHCLTSLVGKRKDAKFCHANCSAASGRARRKAGAYVPPACRLCGGEVPSSSHGNARYCPSEECQEELARRRAERESLWRVRISARRERLWRVSMGYPEHPNVWS